MLKLQRFLPGFFLLVATVLISGLGVTGIYLQVKQQRFLRQARGDLMQRAELALKVFRANRDTPTTQIVQQLGMLSPDPWGNAYTFMEFPSQYQWSSAGPDGAWSTADDIQVSTPAEDAAQSYSPVVSTPGAVQRPAK